MRSSLDEIELYIHCYCPLGLMEMYLAAFFWPNWVLQRAAGQASACSKLCCMQQGLNMISSCDTRFLLQINWFSLLINISSSNINVISIWDQKCIVAFSNNLYVIYNPPSIFSFHVSCPGLRVASCWFLSLSCQHKVICKLCCNIDGISASEANLCMSDVGESSPAATCIRNILLSLISVRVSSLPMFLSHLSEVLG